MNYEFKGTKGKWYPVNFGGFWSIHDEDFYDSTDIFNEEECSEAKENIVLASMAPEMFEFIKRHYKYLNLDDQKEAEQLLKESTEL